MLQKIEQKELQGHKIQLLKLIKEMEDEIINPPNQEDAQGSMPMKKSSDPVNLTDKNNLE